MTQYTPTNDAYSSTPVNNSGLPTTGLDLGMLLVFGVLLVAVGLSTRKFVTK